MIKYIAPILLLFACISIGLGQVHINEYSAANLEGFLDNYNKTEDWIELYNSSDMDMDIGGYHLSDKSSKPDKWEIPEGTIIPAQGYLLFWCSGRDEVCDGNVYHTNFKLSQTTEDETLLFTRPDESVIDEIEVEFTLVESSRCRPQNEGAGWTICTNPTPGNENTLTNQYARYTATPSMDLDAGFYEDTITVHITNNEPGSELRFTLDGTNPTIGSPLYEGPISITETTVVKARAFSNDPLVLDGKIEFNTYLINEDFTLAVFSVAADRVQELANGSGGLIPIGSIEYFDTNKDRVATSFGSLNRHGQDSWVLNHRSLDWVSRDEMGYSKAVFAPLFSSSDRDEYQKFMFRNSGDDNYPAINDNAHQGSTHLRDEYVQTLAQEGGLKLDNRSVERVILFLNGDYWGVYGLRDRPVDHDYTDYYYDQGKYDIQYLTTWNRTELEYGGQKALSDWYRLRDFILENDMSNPENYEKVTDELNVVSLMDYMIVNLNCVASDWLNYNTGWWRGLNPDGDHKKWGYILWDLDATFDYYINYSGVPNTNPNAKPCDIENISSFMDSFFNENPGEAGIGSTVCNLETDGSMCQSIIDGSSPYTADDPYYLLTISNDPRCCEGEWDDICQGLYDELKIDSSEYANCPVILDGSCPYPADDPILIQVFEVADNCCNNWFGYCNNLYNLFANGGSIEYEVRGNVGMHEKIFLKLQEESPEFKQLYYGRQADLMNTVYSCENMLTTLDRMVGVIEPEMPRQIERWGGTMAEWQANIDRLRNFISQRCELLDDGMTTCFDLTGPYELTLMTEPDGVGEIDLNTLDIESFPWTGRYFGGMENTIKARAFEDTYSFSHWETRQGSQILPSPQDRRASIVLAAQDTLVAVFTPTTSINEYQNSVEMNVFPNPTNGLITIQYELKKSMDVHVRILDVLGKEVHRQRPNGNVSSGLHTMHLDLRENVVSPGVYFVQLTADQNQVTKKLTVIK